MVLGPVIAPFAISMLPPLFALLPNSAKVMAMSAEICVKFIIKVSEGWKEGWVNTLVSLFASSIHLHRRYLIIFHPLDLLPSLQLLEGGCGFGGCGLCKMPCFFCRYSSEFLGMAISSFDVGIMNRVLPHIEDPIQLAIKDADAVVRKNGRR